MWKKIIGNFSLALAIVVVIDVISLLFIYKFFWYFTIDCGSAQYLLSANSQVLAAIFALVLLIVNGTVAYVSRDISKQVFNYIFFNTILVFVVGIYFGSILNSLIILAFVEKDPSLLSPNYLITIAGVVSSIVLFAVSFVSLMVYAYQSIKLSIAPFYPFLKQVENSIIPGLSSLVPFLIGRLEFEALLNEGIVKWSLEWVSEGKEFVVFNGKPGYINYISTPDIRQASMQLGKNGNQSIDCLENTEYGRKIEKGQKIFAFEGKDIETNQRVKSILSKSIAVQSNRVGWVNGFEFLDALFRVTEASITKSKVFEEYVLQLESISEKYLTERKKYLGKFDIDLSNYAYPELLDDWFSELNELVLKACITKHELRKQSEFYAEAKKPDFYLQICLHRTAANAYKHDEPVYFNKALDILLYTFPKATLASNSDLPLKQIQELKHVVLNVKGISSDELKVKLNFDKLERYTEELIFRYLTIYKNMPIDSSWRIIFREYNRLRKNLIDDIVYDLSNYDEHNEQIRDKYKRDAIIKLFAQIYLMLMYYYSKLDSVDFKNFRDFIFAFALRLDRVRRYFSDSYSFPLLESVMAYALKFDNKLRWFDNVIKEDEMYDDFTPRTSSLVRTNEYCYKVYYLIHCIVTVEDFFEHDITSNKHILESTFNDFRTRVINQNDKEHLILMLHYNNDISKVKEALKKVKDKFDDYISKE